VFGTVYVMTEGGPLHATDVAVFHIYEEAWELQRVGSAAAMSWTLFAIIFVVTWLHFRTLERRSAGRRDEIGNGPKACGSRCSWAPARDARALCVDDRDPAAWRNWRCSGTAAALAREWRWDNYRGALTVQPFGRYFLNSFVFAALVVSGQLVTAATAGSRSRGSDFRGRGRLVLACLSNADVPAVVVLIPRFLLIDAFGWRRYLPGTGQHGTPSRSGALPDRRPFRLRCRATSRMPRASTVRASWRIFWSVALPWSVRAPTLALFAFLGRVEEPPLAAHRDPLAGHAHGRGRHRVVPLDVSHQTGPTRWPRRSWPSGRSCCCRLHAALPHAGALIRD